MSDAKGILFWLPLLHGYHAARFIVISRQEEYVNQF